MLYRVYIHRCSFVIISSVLTSTIIGSYLLFVLQVSRLWFLRLFRLSWTKLCTLKRCDYSLIDNCLPAYTYCWYVECLIYRTGQVIFLYVSTTLSAIAVFVFLVQANISVYSQANIPAAYLSGTMEWQEQNEILRNLDAGAYKLLYVTPEKIAK